MRNFKLIITFIISFTTLTYADMSIVPFYGSTNYTNSVRDSSTNYGLYYKSENTKAVVEYLDMAFSADNNNSDFTQTNIAFQYNFQTSQTIDIYTTLSYINSSNNSYDGTYTALVGVKNRFNSFTFGANYSYSKYSGDNYIVKSVQQITPSIGFSYGDYKSFMGNYYIKVMYDLIYPDAKVNDLSSEYSSVGVSITQSKGDFQNSVEYYAGDHIFAVRSDGMSVQNLEDIYENSLSLSSKYNISEPFAIQLSYIQKDFVSYADTSKAKLENIVMFLYYNF